MPGNNVYEVHVVTPLGKEKNQDCSNTWCGASHIYNIVIFIAIKTLRLKMVMCMNFILLIGGYHPSFISVGLFFTWIIHNKKKPLSVCLLWIIPYDSTK